MGRKRGPARTKEVASRNCILKSNSAQLGRNNLCAKCLDKTYVVVKDRVPQTLYTEVCIRTIDSSHLYLLLYLFCFVFLFLNGAKILWLLGARSVSCIYFISLIVYLFI